MWIIYTERKYELNYFVFRKPEADVWLWRRKAVQMYRNAGKDKELLAALILFGCTEKYIDTFKVKGDMTAGYDDKGNEIVSVPLTEPAIVRPAKVEQSGAYLYNNT